MLLKYSSYRCLLTSIEQINFPFNAHLNSLLSQKQIMKIKLKKWIIKRNCYYWFGSKSIYKKKNSSCKFNLSLTNLFRMFTNIIMDSSVFSLLLSQGTQKIHWAIEYEQSWFEKMRKNRQKKIYCELWQ